MIASFHIEIDHSLFLACCRSKSQIKTTFWSRHLFLPFWV